MKKICAATLFIILLSCENSLHKFDCQNIAFMNVYYSSKDIMSPVPVNGERIRYSFNQQITSEDKIQIICNKLYKLKERDEVLFLENSINLRVDFFNYKCKKLTLLFDGSHFKIDRTIYKKDTNLLKMLIKKRFKDWSHPAFEP